MDKLGTTTMGVTYDVSRPVDYLGRRTARCAAARRRPAQPEADVHACEAILALSGTTNGRVATQGFDPGEAHRHACCTTSPPSTRASRSPSPTPRPRRAGHHLPGVVRLGDRGRRYSPFTINVERLKPWHTLTGRQHFYLDHDWMAELGENLPVYRPPLNMGALLAEPRSATWASSG